MDINGLWLAEFSTASGAGNGTVVFLDGRILGGDGNYYYSGSYSQLGSHLRAEIEVTHYAGPVSTIFGPVRSIRLKLDGAVGADLIMAQGYDAVMPERRASFRLRRVQRV